MHGQSYCFIGSLRWVLDREGSTWPICHLYHTSRASKSYLQHTSYQSLGNNFLPVSQCSIHSGTRANNLIINQIAQSQIVSIFLLSTHFYHLGPKSCKWVPPFVPQISLTCFFLHIFQQESENVNLVVII